ncbi:MAG TPA: prepilin-type N-terminal cleavage/methylation domain-containing protein [Albitalea sp.]|nr:prepilin-type N-terminal cleavage/methylation domain-containing protein [Albitalea sp.]
MLEPVSPLAVQRGLSLIELMVGLAIGLFIVAVAITLLSSHLHEQRALMLDSRLVQDLRATADLIARDLRRAGYWGDAAAGVWRSGASGVAANPYAAVAPAAAASDAVSFRFSRDSSENQLVDLNEQFGFRLRKGVIEMLIGGSWQAVTDSTTLVVSEFKVEPVVQETLLERLCLTPCPAASSTCPPKQQVRSLALTLSGHPADDTRVIRSVRATVRLRNDALVGACTA